MASRTRRFLSSDGQAGPEQNTLQPSIENNFIGGLKTEFTGLNFPENACTDMENSVVSLIGETVRREGIDYELNFVLNSIASTNLAIATYKWNNVGGDGLTQVLVLQVGGTLYFFRSTNATVASPLSATKLASTVTLSTFLPLGNTLDSTVECQFTDGNGYLFIFHPNLDPLYCTFSAGTITANPIVIQTRDFAGIPDNLAVTARPTTLSTEHKYNLQNQGWVEGPITTSSGSTNTVATGTQTWTVDTGLTISNGASVTLLSAVAIAPGGAPYRVKSTLSGTVSGYVSGTGALTINVTSAVGALGYQSNSWGTISISSLSYITTWQSSQNNYPSNADQWFEFKDSTGAFNPTATVVAAITLSSPAPQGSYILSAFTQDRSAASGISGINVVSTVVRPKTGTWYQGRVFYAGVDAAYQATGDAPYYTWTENIYFSQIVTGTQNFNECYQTNDPTSENLFNLLPSDGGVIVIQGSGSIYKLVPIQTGLLVFAANGIWFITGSAGVGFTANDYTITKISAVRTFSNTSFVFDHNGYPLFWNEEGIYYVHPGKEDILYRSGPYGHGGLEVHDMTLGTIRTFYQAIPLISRKYARGDYDPLTFTITWIYRTTNETDITSRYNYDSALNLNIANKAFYPYTFPTTTARIHDIRYVSSPGGSTAPQPVFKYVTSFNGQFTFAEENDSTHWKDFFSVDSVGVDYTAYFITGYKLHGKAIFDWNPLYVYLYSRNSPSGQYFIESRWDYATSGNSGKWSAIQKINNQSLASFNGLSAPSTSNFGMLLRKHKLRGHGKVMQIKVTSVSGQPFDVMGWAMMDAIGMGI